MTKLSRPRRLAVLCVVAVAALAGAAGAAAHAHVSPPVAVAGDSQIYSLAVPTEKEGATTTQVVLTVPQGFSIDSFVPAPGWQRSTQSTGSGEDSVIQKVTWTGGRVSTGEDAFFQFLGRPGSSGTYTFTVQQTYSDGSVVDWSGPESSDTPAPVLEARASLGGGGGSSTLAIVALVVGALGLVVGAAALALRSGRQLA